MGITSHIRRETMRILLAGQGGVCFWCRKRSNEMTFDHLLPKSKGGSDRPRNLVAACHDCNCNRADMSAERFAEQSGFVLPEAARTAIRDEMAVQTRSRLVPCTLCTRSFDNAEGLAAHQRDSHGVRC